MGVVNWLHLLQSVVELSEVLHYKVSLDEAGALVEDVVPRLDVKFVPVLPRIIFLDFVFDNERHVAEG